MPILSSIAQAPKRSPLHSITLDNVAKFLQDLARTSEVRYEANAAETAKKASTEEEKEQEQGENREMDTEEGEETMLKTTLQERLALQTCEEILEFPGGELGYFLSSFDHLIVAIERPLVSHSPPLCSFIGAYVLCVLNRERKQSLMQDAESIHVEWK